MNEGMKSSYPFIFSLVPWLSKLLLVVSVEILRDALRHPTAFREHNPEKVEAPRSHSALTLGEITFSVLPQQNWDSCDTR